MENNELHTTFFNRNFALYNLSNDIGEQTDLKESEPEKYEEMLNEWTKYKDEVKVQIPSPSSR